MKFWIIVLVCAMAGCHHRETPTSQASSPNPVDHPTGVILHVICFKTLTINPCIMQATQVCGGPWTPQTLPGDLFPMAEPFTDWDTQMRGFSMIVQCNQ